MTMKGEAVSACVTRACTENGVVTVSTRAIVDQEPACVAAAWTENGVVTVSTRTMVDQEPCCAACTCHEPTCRASVCQEPCCDAAAQPTTVACTLNGTVTVSTR